MNNMQMAMNWMNSIFNNAKKMQSNPMARNVEKMFNSHDEKGLEQMARNICKERGIDADKLYGNVKNHFGM